MRFQVIPNAGGVPGQGRNVGYLWEDAWNDWFKYQTLYVLTYFDADGNKHELGGVKIGQLGMTGEPSRPALPPTFERLDERFFSIGQDEKYYTAVMALTKEARDQLLTALHDLAAADEPFYRNALAQRVTGESLLRHVSVSTIEGQYRRILDGGVPLTSYKFRYTGPLPRAEGLERLLLEFEVEPDSRPPTNIHVLIGRNGVGKTFILKGMTRALVEPGDVDADGEFSTVGDFLIPDSSGSPFANVLSVTFSAFDHFETVRQSRNTTDTVRYVTVGLRKRVKTKTDDWATITQDPDDLAKDFSDSARACIRGARSQRWRDALTTLETDPLFAEAEVTSLASLDEERFAHNANALYRNLSSGHKIVLLTITKLVEYVEEKTLLLMDEPEAHLHPPLLSAFVRAVSDLLINRNGVAIIATHSPVVLQEVPRSCVWKIVRHGAAAEANRPDIETFAENVGILTREVFGLEVTRSGFHKMLADAIQQEQTIEEVAAKFDHSIGSEGRALISSMLASRSSDDGE